jgi:16S rRNA (adenine(1408)-N(1))-methyltransferase
VEVVGVSSFDGRVDVVVGKQIERVPGCALRAIATGYPRVVVDLGTGDGRFAYHLARRNANAFVIAVDAAAERMRDSSFRAGRKPVRGGVDNVVYLRAAVDDLPDALRGIADEIWILLPWGRLLEVVMRPDVRGLERVVSLGKPGAWLRVRVNGSALASSGRHLAASADLEAERSRLATLYAWSGLSVRRLAWGREVVPTSWGKRLAHGRDPRVLSLDAVVLRSG